MKVFVSSLITGMEPIRLAARKAVETLRHAPIMAEDFGTQPNSPHVACLTGLRQSDVVVLILGERYGAEQASGLSATHEEYREAKGFKPVIAFVQEDVVREPKQAAFVDEVQGWSGGLFRGGFRNADDPVVAITRALHDYELATAVAPVDEADLQRRAMTLLPPAARGGYSGGPMLALAVAGGPHQQILRPVEIEKADLAESLHQAALFGDARIFDSEEGIRRAMEHDTLVLSQDRAGEVRLDQSGGLRLVLPFERAHGQMGMMVLIKEDVDRALVAGLTYAATVLDRIDPTQKLTHVGLAARIDGAEYRAWRTRAEHDVNVQSVSLGFGAGDQRSGVHVVRPRAALRLDRVRLVEDLLVPLRRQWKSAGR